MTNKSVIIQRHNEVMVKGRSHGSASRISGMGLGCIILRLLIKMRVRIRTEARHIVFVIEREWSIKQLKHHLGVVLDMRLNEACLE